MSGAIPPLPLRLQDVHGDFFLLCTVLLVLSNDTHARVYCTTSTILALKPSWAIDSTDAVIDGGTVGCIIWLLIERSIQNEYIIQKTTVHTFHLQNFRTSFY
jgi:hypothetical protein